MEKKAFLEALEKATKIVGAISLGRYDQIEIELPLEETRAAIRKVLEKPIGKRFNVYLDDKTLYLHGIT